MVMDNPNETIKKSIVQLMNSLRLDLEKEIISINHTVNSGLNNLTNDNTQTNIHKEEKIADLSDSLLNQVVTIFNK